MLGTHSQSGMHRTVTRRVHAMSDIKGKGIGVDEYSLVVVVVGGGGVVVVVEGRDEVVVVVAMVQGDV